jgi:hypothetical protein
MTDHAHIDCPLNYERKGFVNLTNLLHQEEFLGMRHPSPARYICRCLIVSYIAGWLVCGLKTEDPPFPSSIATTTTDTTPRMRYQSYWKTNGMQGKSIIPLQVEEFT